MINTISKFIVFAFEYWLAEEVIDSGIYALSYFRGHPNLELVFVMMMMPFTLNTCQYWIQDNFLKGTDFIEKQKQDKKAND